MVLAQKVLAVDLLGQRNTQVARNHPCEKSRFCSLRAREGEKPCTGGNRDRSLGDKGSEGALEDRVGWP